MNQADEMVRKLLADPQIQRIVRKMRSGLKPGESVTFSMRGREPVTLTPLPKQSQKSH